MNTVKRSGLAALFIIAASLLSGTPARAAIPPITNDLWCLVDESDPDYGASGVVTVSKIQWHEDPYGGWGGPSGYFSAQLTVKCKGLTPGATYTVTMFQFGSWLDVGVFTAGSKGDGKLQTQIEFSYFSSVLVSREQSDGTVVPVLEGDFIRE
jgi:hypothetical protein